MSSPFILQGKEYLNFKDACALGACSRKNMQKLCIAGMIASVWYGDALFVERASLEFAISKGDLDRVAMRLHNSEEVWEKKMNNHFLALGMSALLIATVLSFPLVFLDGFGSRIDVAAVPSTYNNLSVISQADSGVANALSAINENIADTMVRGIWTAYEFARSLF